VVPRRDGTSGPSRRGLKTPPYTNTEVSNVGYTNGFRVSDTRPWWRETDRRSVTLSAVDWHPNARGHDILAQGMAGVLMTQDVMTKRGAATRTPLAGRSAVSFRPDSVTSSGPYQR
jgi:hypothetical protein